MSNQSPRSVSIRANLDARVQGLHQRFEQLTQLPTDIKQVSDTNPAAFQSMRAQSKIIRPEANTIPFPSILPGMLPSMMSQAKLVKQLSFERKSVSIRENSVMNMPVMNMPVMNKSVPLSRWAPIKKNLGTIIDSSKKSEEVDDNDGNHVNNNNSNSNNNNNNNSSSNSATITTLLEDPDMKEYYDEDEILQEYWKSFQIPPITSPDEIQLDSIKEPESDYLEELEGKLHNISLTVSRVPESVIKEHRDRLEDTIIEERKQAVERLKSKEVDLLWREHLARDRILEQEKKLQQSISKEKQETIEQTIQKRKDISHEFKMAREDLEAYLRQQKARIQDKFGQISYSDMSLGRKLETSVTGLPQPLEIRIHFLRAVKSKLPKGAYVMLVSQYDSLGSKPLWWSKVGPYGIDKTMPGVTKPIKHYGRYFDRIMKFEDSLFTLCPPRSMLKPSYSIVLEIFQLANRTNPYDRCVGWTALPMCNEHYGLVEGKLKLPVLRGDHSPNCQHFRKMESAMAKDLNNWLCNIYIELRQLPLDVLKNKMDLTSKDIKLDYVNHSINTDAHDILRERLEYKPTDPNNSIDIDLMTPKLSNHKNNNNKVPLSIDKGLYRRSGRLKTSSTSKDMNNTFEENIQESKDHIALLSPSKKHRKDNYSYLSFNQIYQTITNYMNSNISNNSNNQNSSLPFLPSNKVGIYVPDKIIDRDNQSPTPIVEENDHENGYDVESGNQELNQIIPITHKKKGSDKKKVLSFKIDLYTKSDDNQQNGSASAEVLDVDKDQNQEKTNESMKKSSPLNISQLHSSHEAIEIYERGYNSEEDFYLDDEQRGKLAGIESVHSEHGQTWAQAMLEGKVIRRYQSDGPRFDSEAISLLKEDENENRDKQPTGVLYPVSKYSIWKKLEDFREVETFTMSIASDPSQRKRLLPKVIQKSKLRFLALELFGEFSYYKWGTFNFYINIVVFVIAIWFRVYVHYLGEYFYLTAVNTPVYSFIPYATEISFKYMSSSISVGAEVGVITIGPACNMFIFFLFGVATKLFYKVAGFMLDSISNFVAFFGLVSALDPILILIIDLIYTNYDCSRNHASCSSSYTHQTCHCFEGDFIKLWNRFIADEDSGVSGIIITLIVYTGVMTCSFLLLYEYLVYVHRDARILDLWRRINAPAEEFFLPDDYEISAEELISICTMAQRWRGLDGSRRKVHISTFTDRSQLHMNGIQESIKHYAIYNYGLDGSRGIIHRHFIMLEDGTILEIFEQFHHKGTKSEAYASHERSRLALEAMIEEEERRMKNNVLTPVEINQEVILSHSNPKKNSPTYVSFDPNGTIEAATIFAGFENA